MTSIEIIVVPIAIFVAVILCLISIVIFYWIRTNWGDWSTSDSEGRRPEVIFTTDDPLSNDLPPSYSGLSIRLPPSYSTACRMIGFRPSQERINELQSANSLGNNSATSLGNQSQQSVAETSLSSMNNYLNLDVTERQESTTVHM